MIDDLIKRTRTFRRFDQTVAVDRKTLEGLVDLARHSASARNLQPLKYFLSCDPETNAKIFDSVLFAAALKDWDGPEEGERPTAYIVMLGDTKLTSEFFCDHGIASQSIMLGARDRDLGGCIMASVKRPKLRQSLRIPDRYQILLVLAIGKPAETVVIEPLPPDGNFDYWHDSDGVHHVPKRSLEEIILDLEPS